MDRSAPLVKRGVIFPQIFIDFELAVCRLCLREADYVVCSNYSWPRVYTDIYIYKFEIVCIIIYKTQFDIMITMKNRFAVLLFDSANFGTGMAISVMCS